MTDNQKFTREEFAELFGEEVPIEAVDLVWNSSPEATIGEIREQLRAMGLARKRSKDAYQVVVKHLAYLGIPSGVEVAKWRSIAAGILAVADAYRGDS